MQFTTAYHLITERDIHCVACIKQSNNSYFKMPNQLSRNVTEYMYRRIFSLLINHQTFDVQFCLHKHNNKNGIIYLYVALPLLSASFVRLVKMLADSEGEIKHEI